jgi:hypothetical protein
MQHQHKANKVFLLVLGTLGLLGGVSRYLAGNDPGNSDSYDTVLQHGRNLAMNICGQCHYNESTGTFMGKEMKEVPGIIGKIYSSNLTHSAKYGLIDKYSDMQLINLLKTGTAKDGRYVAWMIRPNLADTDLHALIVYFRSNDSALIATDKIAGVTKETAAGKAAAKVIARPIPFKRGVKAPAENDSVAYGRYLVDNLACYHCHSKNVVGLDYQEPEKSKGYLQGGYKMKTPEGKKIVAPGLTADKEKGIGKLTRQQFRKAVQKGIMPEGEILSAPMPRFKHLTDKQADAIYAYLFSLPLKTKQKK